MWSVHGVPSSCWLSKLELRLEISSYPNSSQCWVGTDPVHWLKIPSHRDQTCAFHAVCFKNGARIGWGYYCVIVIMEKVFQILTGQSSILPAEFYTFLNVCLQLDSIGMITITILTLAMSSMKIHLDYQHLKLITI